ncbi:MAG: hypothetical protein KDI54_10705 [Gammaproteobacteria bacterium]|nr:hypothetical protein [Gammaproteobacteria bacterium]
MKTKRAGRKNTENKTVRASISFPAEVYADLERIAEANKVSLAWVVYESFGIDTELFCDSNLLAN